jgi:hypothetical protein
MSHLGLRLEFLNFIDREIKKMFLCNGFIIGFMNLYRACIMISVYI